MENPKPSQEYGIASKNERSKEARKRNEKRPTEQLPAKNEELREINGKPKNVVERNEKSSNQSSFVEPQRKHSEKSDSLKVDGKSTQIGSSSESMGTQSENEHTKSSSNSEDGFKLKQLSKDEKNALNSKKKDESQKLSETQKLRKRPARSKRCCGRTNFIQRKPTIRKPCSNKNQATKTLARHISNATSLYTEFLTRFPNLKMLLTLCQDILLLKILNRITRKTSHSNIKKNTASACNLNGTAQHTPIDRKIESVESIAEFSLDRLFGDNVQLAQRNESSRGLKRNRSESSLSESEEEPQIKKMNNNGSAGDKIVDKAENLEQQASMCSLHVATQHSCKNHTCKCYQNHMSSDITNTKVRKMLEDYEKMIFTCDNRTENEVNRKKPCNEVIRFRNNVHGCMSDAYDCECKANNTSENKEFFEAITQSSVLANNETAVDEIIKKTKSETGNEVTNILDQIVSEALENIRNSYRQHVKQSDLNDEQNHADDEQSSDSESECKSSEAYASNLCRKMNVKSENMNYLLLFGKSKSQIKKRDVSNHFREQQILAKKGSMSKQDPDKSHVEKVIKHYRILQ